MSQQIGRPKKDNPMNERLYIRVTKEEKENIVKFSKEIGCTLLELLRIGIESIRKK